MSNVEKKSNWGRGIAFLYAAFALFILSLVVFVSFQKHDLVTTNYYEKDQLYQQQIERSRRAIDGDKAPGMVYHPSSEELTLQFKKVEPGESLAGQVMLFRPSNADLDQSYELMIDPSDRQLIDLSDYEPGLWRVQILWREGAIEYFSEQTLVVQ